MNYCIDCQYCESGSDHFCTNPKLRSSVDRTLTPARCADTRDNARQCGLEGKWFEGRNQSIPPMPSETTDEGLRL